MTPETVHERFAQYLKDRDRDSSPSTAEKGSRKR